MVFASCFSLLSLLYLVLAPKLYLRAAHPYAILAVEAVNTVFYLAGFIAVAAFLAGLTFCHGAVCGAGRADSVVAAAAFCAWAASTALAAKAMFTGGKQALGAKSPAMGQA